MLTPGRALTLNAQSGRPLPRVPDLDGLYRMGVLPRFGEVMMIAGRSGTQKSGFALWLVDQFDLPTLYFSADMSPFTASSRIACTKSGLTTEEVESIMLADGVEKAELLDLLADSKITFSFGRPISGRQIDLELDAYIELHDAFPEVIVFDNLMDFEGAEADYAAQMEVMQRVTELTHDTGAAVIVMHHATDKSREAKYDHNMPPSREQVKGGLSEKPALSLSVALDVNTMEYRIACIKQRMGPSDPSGRRFSTIICDPERTRFHSKSRLVSTSV